MAIVIGPARVADEQGTHEPGDVVLNPSPALIALAESKRKDKESGEFLAQEQKAEEPKK